MEGRGQTLFCGSDAYVVAGDADTIFDRYSLSKRTGSSRVGGMALGLSRWGGRLGAGGWRWLWGTP